MNYLLYLPILCLSLLFSQTEIDTLWTFTNCGQEGRFGPVLGLCEAEYSGTTLEGQICKDGGRRFCQYTEIDVGKIDIVLSC